MYQVVKRDGKVTEFNIAKISLAITKAFDATGKDYNPDIIDLLALRVTADYQKKISEGKITEQGTHDELMELGGTYKHLYSLQFRENEL